MKMYEERILQPHILHVAICDRDNRTLHQIRDTIQGIVDRLEIFPTQISIFQDEMEFYRRIGDGEYHLVFIEINMPKEHFRKIICRCRSIVPELPFVLMSESMKSILELQTIRPYRIMVKQHLEEILESILMDFYQGVRIYYAKPAFQDINMSFNTIIALTAYIEYTARYSSFIKILPKSQQEKKQVFYQKRVPLKALEEKLNRFGFVRINKNIIVNVRFIDRIEKNVVYLRGIQEYLFIGRQHKAALIKAIEDHKENRYTI